MRGLHSALHTTAHDYDMLHLSAYIFEDTMREGLAFEKDLIVRDLRDGNASHLKVFRLSAWRSVQGRRTVHGYTHSVIVQSVHIRHRWSACAACYDESRLQEQTLGYTTVPFMLYSDKQPFDSVASVIVRRLRWARQGRKAGGRGATDPSGRP